MPDPNPSQMALSWLPLIMSTVASSMSFGFPGCRQQCIIGYVFHVHMWLCKFVFCDLWLCIIEKNKRITTITTTTITTTIIVVVVVKIMKLRIEGFCTLENRPKTHLKLKSCEISFVHNITNLLKICTVHGIDTAVFCITLQNDSDNDKISYRQTRFRKIWVEAEVRRGILCCIIACWWPFSML